MSLGTAPSGVGVVRFGNPRSRSRWSPRSESACFDRLTELEADPDVRVIVVTGSTADFCAGPEPEALSADAERDPRGDHFPRSISKPIVAAVDGACHGIGLSLALMCDVRVVSSTTRISAGFASYGLVAEHGVHWLLQRTCGHGTAADLLLTDRRIDGPEAFRLGLAQYLAQDSSALEHALGMAARMAQRLSPLSLAVIKQQLTGGAEGGLEASVERGERLVQAVARAGDFEEAVAAARRGERPAFGPLDQTTLARVQA